MKLLHNAVHSYVSRDLDIGIPAALQSVSTQRFPLFTGALNLELDQKAVQTPVSLTCRRTMRFFKGSTSWHFQSHVFPW